MNLNQCARRASWLLGTILLLFIGYFIKNEGSFRGSLEKPCFVCGQNEATHKEGPYKGHNISYIWICNECTPPKSIKPSLFDKEIDGAFAKSKGELTVFSIFAWALAVFTGYRVFAKQKPSAFPST